MGNHRLWIRDCGADDDEGVADVERLASRLIVEARGIISIAGTTSKRTSRPEWSRIGEAATGAEAGQQVWTVTLSVRMRRCSRWGWLA